MALTLQKVKKAAGEYDPELITRVRLPSASLTAMGGLETVVNMIELALPNNAIRAISGLEACVKLERIDLSSNQISRIEGLEGLTSLRFLDLRENQIRELGNIDALVNLHCLEQLHLQNGADGTRRNAVCEEATYLSTIKTRLPALTTLDNERMALKMDAGEADGLQADAELLEPLPAESWCQAEDWDLPSARGGAADPMSKDAAKIAKDVRAVTDDCAQLQRDALEMMQEAKADLGGSG
mmetsp:Transcript_11139/g.29839  ORF Transcript_11139/g.29839 Transcript_11139/m.29839 type:complete len:240 (-) Transcript_11139:437-1156(-)